jgi:hypothetical protein
MTLGQLIAFLRGVPPETPVPLGFHGPHSYRGYYDELAFQPLENTTAGAMLAAAESALGATYQGYKGGDFTMSEWTDVWLANWGDCGEGIGPVLLRYMVGQAATEGEPGAAP